MSNLSYLGFINYWYYFKKYLKGGICLCLIKSYIVYCCLQKHMSISKKYKIILMSLMRSLYKCHDYMIYLETILCMYLCRNIFILEYCVFLLLAAFDNYLDKNSMQDEISNNVNDNMKCTLKYNIWWRQEVHFYLWTFASPISDMQYNANGSFAFLSHCPKSIALELCKQNHLHA